MPGLFIPDDWEQPTDGFCDLTITVPNSQLWRALVKGQILNLAQVTIYDPDTEETTTLEEAAEIGMDIFDSVVKTCP